MILPRWILGHYSKMFCRKILPQESSLNLVEISLRNRSSQRNPSKFSTNRPSLFLVAKCVAIIFSGLPQVFFCHHSHILPQTHTDTCLYKSDCKSCREALQHLENPLHKQGLSTGPCHDLNGQGMLKRSAVNNDQAAKVESEARESFDQAIESVVHVSSVALTNSRCAPKVVLGVLHMYWGKLVRLKLAGP